MATGTVEGGELPRAMLDTATQAADWVIIWPVVLPLLGAALLLMLRQSRSTSALFAGLVVVGVIACELELLRNVLATGPVTMTMGNWLPPFGISFTADVMGAGFALAASVVTLIVLLYAEPELADREVRHGFYSLVLLLNAGVAGSFLTGDLFNLYVWFEVMLISSFGLMIMGGRKIQIDGAVKYGFINFLATSFFLLALGLLYGLLGTLNMADIIRTAPDAPQGPMLGIAALLLLAFGVKAAAFPVNAWLPASYHTPTAAVSALFGGLLTKVGAYAMVRSLVALLPASGAALDGVLTALAVTTLILAPLGALAQTNLRRAVGFFLIGGIGSILAGLSIPGFLGMAGATSYIFHSILTISALYLISGLIERATQTKEIRGMGGLYAANSILSILFLVLVFAIAGLPPFLGFWPKLMLVQASVVDADYLLLSALLLNSLLTVIAGSRIWAHIFWRAGREGEGSEQPNDRLIALSRRDNWFSLVPTSALVAGIVVVGLFPALLIDASRTASSDLLQTGRYVSSTGLEEAE